MNHTPPIPAGLEPMALFVQQQAAKLMQKVPLLGSVSWLMLAGSATRHILLSELEWRVMPPLVLNQAKIFMRDGMPVAYASWALLSPQVAHRFRQPPHRLTPAEWKSGSEAWLVDVMAPFGGVQEVLRDLRESVLRGRPIHQLALIGEPMAEVFTWPAAGTA